MTYNIAYRQLNLQEKKSNIGRLVPKTLHQIPGGGKHTFQDFASVLVLKGVEPPRGTAGAKRKEV